MRKREMVLGALITLFNAYSVSSAAESMTQQGAAEIKGILKDRLLWQNRSFWCLLDEDHF